VTTTRTYDVPGISCGHCKSAIEGEVAKVAAVDSVVVDIDARTATVTGDVDEAAVRAAIDEAGYDVAAVR
jgi:copper chaperone